ncbi:MAG TPA: nuclear transport factor 2 family protein [Streptosporangiaceae bacterium]
MPEAPSDTSARGLLARFYQAMIDKSADDLADLYAPDAVHEFPFAMPGLPPRLNGREEVRASYRAMWGATPAKVEEIRDVTTYDTTDPGVLVSRHVTACTLPDGSAFAVPGLLIMRTRDGLLAHVADYMDTGSTPRA